MKNRMISNNDYEKRLQETYERYMRDEISVEEIEPAMLFRINRMLEKELAEKARFMEEIIRLIREDDNKY